MDHHSLNPRRANIALWAALLLFVSCTIGVVNGQETASSPSLRHGLQIEAVSAYFDYYSAGLPNSGSFQPSAKLQSDGAAGASVQIGWIRSGERSSYSFSYTASLVGRIRYSEWNAWNHALSLTASRKLAPLWTLGFSLGGDVSSREQSLFSPTVLSNVVSAPASFDDLASALLASKFANPQLASAFTAAPLLESPLRNVIYGQRTFTAAAQASLSYSHSPRLSVVFQAGGGRNQGIGENQPGNGGNAFLNPSTTSGSAGVSISYSLSPRMQLGGNVVTTRVWSLQDAYTTSSLGTLGWSVARRWVVQFHGGVGVTNPVQQTFLPSPVTPRPVGGGSLGFKTLTQTFLGGFDRTVSDSYGLGASTTSSASFSWRWRRPGLSWWLESSAAWQQLHGKGLGDTSGYRATAGIGRSVSAHLVLFAQYGYLNSSGQLERLLYSQDQSALRVSLTWSPHSDLSY